MVDITRQVAHWRDGAREEWQVAMELLDKGRVRHALFFAHLALEKALRAHVCRHIDDLAPRTHNLVRLAETAALELTAERLELLSALNESSQAGRYPDTLAPPPHVGTGAIANERGQRGAAVADAAVVGSVRRYLDALRRQHALDVHQAVVFGSCARGRADEWSDIDLVVVAARFDAGIARSDVELLWRVAARTDSRIEPIPCGVRQWQEDQSSAIIEIARREGEVILPDAA